MSTKQTPRHGAMHRPFTAVRVVLSFGLVLGVVVVATDAAWTDQEYASGTFTAARFDIEGSVDGTGFASHPTADSAPALTFNADGMYPGQVVAAPWAIRAAPGSLAGTVVVSEPTAPTGSSSSLIADLAYRLYWDTVATCSSASAPSAAGGYLAGGSGSYVPLGQAPATTPVAVAAAPNAATAGTPVYLCFQVQLSANAANADQGQTASATWLATGTNS